MRKPPFLVFDLLISLAAGLLVGAMIAAFSPAPFGRGFIAAGILAFLCIFALVRLWRRMGESRTLVVIMAAAFLIRLAAGIVLMEVLPAAGYDTAVQNAGYVYSDAYERDTEAFRLASSGASLLEPFKAQVKSDQYGGLLAFSALIYRALSPDAARPLLITLLAAFAMTAGIAFLWNTILVRFDKNFAVAAAWLMALFPEGVLLSSSQMREPFLIGLACIAFWAVMQWQDAPWKAFLVSAASIAGAVLISSPAGLIIGGICLAIVLLEWTIQTPLVVNRWTGIELLAILGFAAFISGWMWLAPTLKYETYLTQASSGMVQSIFKLISPSMRIPFVTGYGIFQPVLPAALTDPSLPIWMVIAILRAVGWYFFLPFFFYAFFAIWKYRKEENGGLLLLINVVFMVWVIVSSARGGGDQWDNPRYRAILLPWMAVLFGWTWQRVKQSHPVWFWRWVAVIAEFVVLFTYWYVSRKFVNIPGLSINIIVSLVGGFAFLILAGGLVWDKVKAKRMLPAH